MMDCGPKFEEVVLIRALQEELLIGIQLQFVARPFMQKLADRLHEMICLAVPSGERMLVVDMVSDSKTHEISGVIGRHFSLPVSRLKNNAPEVVNYKGNAQGSAVQLLRVPLWGGGRRVCGWLCIVDSERRLSPKRVRELLSILRDEGETLSCLLSSVSHSSHSKRLGRRAEYILKKQKIRIPN